MSTLDHLAPPRLLEKLAVRFYSDIVGQIKHPYPLWLAVDRLAKLWLVVVVITQFAWHPMTHLHGLQAWMWNGSVIVAFLSIQWIPMERKRARASKPAPIELVALVRDELANEPLVPEKDNGPSRFLLLDEPELSAAQVWLVLAWQEWAGRRALIENVVIADSIDEVRQWADSKSMDPIYIVSETELAVAQKRYGDWWNWEKSTRKYVRLWRNRLHKVRANSGNGAEWDARHFENSEERDRQIEMEGVGLEKYWEAHATEPPESSSITRAEWIAEVRQIGKEECDARLAEFCSWLSDQDERQAAGAPRNYA
ncbi:hypothetical protein [Frateuria sp. Soil773]|uniref:hypothetical protein n=1 Tax=Frateuria sp. Soil773 TaxID=1736407 RepID=UPI0012FB075C|nr:hypothetical protein [Frateuria sp. Soil773]